MGTVGGGGVGRHLPDLQIPLPDPRWSVLSGVEWVMKLTVW